MEGARGFVVQAEENPHRLPYRPPTQRNQRGIVVTFQLKHLAIGQRNLQVPILHLAEQSHAEGVEEVERLVDATTPTAQSAVVVTEIAEETFARKPQACTCGKIVDVGLVGVVHQCLGTQDCTPHLPRVGGTQLHSLTTNGTPQHTALQRGVVLKPMHTLQRQGGKASVGTVHTAPCAKYNLLRTCHTPTTEQCGNDKDNKLSSHIELKLHLPKNANGYHNCGNKFDSGTTDECRKGAKCHLEGTGTIGAIVSKFAHERTKEWT